MGIIALLVVLPQRGITCSCAGTGSVETSLAGAELVFTGTAVASEASTWCTGDTPRDGRSFTFAIDRVWKGDPPPVQVIVTGLGGGDCGWPFEIGTSYLIYAYHSPCGSTPVAHLCTRTARIEDAAADIAALGAPRHLSRGRWVAMIIVGAVAAVALGFVFTAWRARSRPA